MSHLIYHVILTTKSRLIAFVIMMTESSLLHAYTEACRNPAHQNFNS